MNKRRLLIVGGVAGGASCAARARRLCEQCEIVIFDRGPYVSFANCGLPYFVGDVIQAEENLLVATPELFKDRFNIQVCTETEVLHIDRDRKAIEVKDLQSGGVKREGYDALVLATGAQAIRPPLPGIGLPGIFVLRTIPDSRKVREAILTASHAAVVGGGFIGLEMAENLARRGLLVTVIESANQVLPPLDAEMAVFVEDHLKVHGVNLRLGEAVKSFEQKAEGGLIVNTAAGGKIEADVVILGIGVKPETSLAKAAGLELGDLGGIRVDEYMKTSDPCIWAVGDVVEVKNRVTGAWQLLALAGPANRQGRVAATSIIRGERKNTPAFHGVLGTAVCGLFGLTVAATGASEKMLKRAGMENYQSIYLHPGNHASYFPGAKPIHLKLLFSSADGRILGAQAIGEADVARRIDVIATAMQMGGTVFDLEESELCYAPQFGAAKDPVNLAGMIAANHLRCDLPLADWKALPATDAQLLDVRSAAEFAREAIPGAVNIPLEELRERLSELPKDRAIWLVCGVGQRAYYAVRALQQNGYRVKVLSGGMQTYQTIKAQK